MTKRPDFGVMQAIGSLRGTFPGKNRKPAGPVVLPLALSYPISPALWTADEDLLDATPRKTRIRIPNVPQQTGFLIGAYRGPDPAGNTSQIAVMPYVSGGYDWLSTGQNARGAKVYNRLYKRPADLSSDWTPITGPADTKEFTASDVPAVPSGSWVSLGSGTARITLAPWDGKRRAVTSGQYSINGAAWVTFVSAAEGANTVLDLAGLTDGVSTPVRMRWVNANVDASNPAPILTLNLIAAAAEPAPPAPTLTYLVDGSGTKATVYFEAEGVLPESIETLRYRINGGAEVVVSGAEPLNLTGLSATQSFAAEWANSTGYSETTTITLVAALPAYADADWSLTNAPDAAGDKLAMAFTGHPTPPDGVTRDGIQWTQDNGATWSDFATSPISTGQPATLANIKVRAIYSIGPGMPSAVAKSATPGYPPIVTAFPTASAPVREINSTNSNVRAVTLPAHEATDHLFVPIMIDGNPSTVTAVESGWSIVKIGVAGTDGAMWYAHKVAASNAETLNLNLSASENVSTHAFKIAASRELLVGSPVIRTTSGSVNLPSMSFGGEVEKAYVILAFGTRGELAQQSAAPDDGFSGWLTNTTAANSGGVKMGTCYKEVEAASYDPPAWPDSNAGCVSVMFAFLPEHSVPPVTTLNVTVSAAEVAQGDSITFTMSADGRAPITYQLTIDGAAYTNETGTFTVTPTSGVKPWTASAANASGSDDSSGSVTVQANMLFSIGLDSIYNVTFDAASISHSVTPASYELEWGLVEGAATSIVQAGAIFNVTFPSNGAYCIRARAKDVGGTPGTWGDYVYYAPMVVGGISFPIQNAQAVQISPLTPVAPVEVVPVAGRQVRLHEPRPAFTTEIFSGRTYYLNGVAINPAAPGLTSFGGNQFWDSRQGDKDALTVTESGFFSLAKVTVGWPKSLSLNDTVSKCLSRPTSMLSSTGNGQGYRDGVLDQHGGLVVLAALSTVAPMQSAPAIIKEAGWTPGNVSLPGWQAMLDIITGTMLATAGMTLPPRTTLRTKMGRFNPAHKLMRGGNYWQNSQESMAPFNSRPGETAGNYYMYQNDAQVAALMISDAVDNDWKREMLGAYVLRGINIDYPGNRTRMGAGINQALMLPVALSRIARGMNLLDLGTTQTENIPFMFGFWDATTLSYLDPHTSSSRPVFSRRRTISAVQADGASGHNFIVPWNINTGTGERKQRMVGLNVVRESTGEELPWRATDGDMTGNRDASGALVDGGGYQKFATTGFFSTPLAAGEVVYLKIPAAAAGGFAVGEPFWMYEGAGAVFGWDSFNPSPDMSYRSINEPQGKLLLLHALSAWPNVAGSNWDACKQYTIKSRQGSWPGSGFDYGFTASGFVSEMWGAHAATLGITL